MRIDVVCSDPAHPVNPWLIRWASSHQGAHDIAILRDVAALRGGDFLFLISCHQIVRKAQRDKYRFVLVIHASDLPMGRGWSPMAWEVLHGADKLTVTLLNAEDAVDSGAVWRKLTLPLDGTELFDEINAKLFAAEVVLMDWALKNCGTAVPVEQSGEPTFWPKRTPSDGEIDPGKSLAESFEALRVADPERYPAYFNFRGATYRIRLEKVS